MSKVKDMSPLKTKTRQTYTFEEAFEASKEYFFGNELAAKVCIDKYLLRNEQDDLVERTPEDMHRRLAGEFARIDSEKYGADYNTQFELYYVRFKRFSRLVPQGSPMAAVGNTFQTLSASNCVVIDSPEDSISGIMKTATEFAQLFKRRCGVGTDISRLRPDGFFVKNAARTTSGAWSFADLFSYITGKIGQSGRRGATMITISVHHPDVEQFAKMKADKTAVTKANVSIRITDEFMRAVESDSDYEQRWPCEGEAQFSKMVNAKAVWNTIVEMATLHAEPGLIFWDKATERLPAESYEQFKSSCVNPCCFSENSDVWVVTKEGIKEIKKITSNDLVWIDSAGTWAKTSGYTSVGEHDVFKICFSNNEEMIVTDNHKFEVTKPRRDGTKLVYDNLSLVELKDIEPGDRVSVHVNEVTDVEWGNKGTYKEGLILGWLSGDGCLSYSKHTDSWPTMHLPFWDKEHDVADKIWSVVDSFGYGLKLQKTDDGKGNNIRKVSSNRLTKDLTEKYEINIWKFRKGFNPFLYDATEEFISGYLSAYLSADGTVTNAPQNSRYCVQLASVERPRLEQVKNLLLLYGIKSGIGLMRQGGKLKLGGYSDRDCYRLSITGYQNLKRLYERIGFISGYKQEALGRIISNHTGRSHMLNFIKIESITPAGKELVGCIEVEDHHKFTANGIISGNSEIILSPYDSCRLLSMNLTGYVRNAFTSESFFDYKTFEEDAKISMRLLDNLVDLELELIERILESCDSPEEVSLWKKLYRAGEQGRRTGLGTHGLADTLAQLRIKYDSENALKWADKTYESLRNSAYSASVDLAEERGAFPAFDWQAEKGNPFIQDLPESIKKRMAVSGRRNISILTQAPTGTVALVSKCGNFDRHSVSSGVEPTYRLSYTKRKKINRNDSNSKVDHVDELGDRWQDYKVVSSNLQNYYEVENSSGYSDPPDYFVTSDKIDWQFRVKLQGTEQKYIDHCISSTVNLPKGTPPEVVGGIYMKAWKENLKGITVYVDGSRMGVMLEDKPKSKIVRHKAPDRPRDLPCDIHFHTVKGEPWTALVGCLDGEPYELFGGYGRSVSLPQKYKKGFIRKRGKGKYDLHIPVGGSEFLIIRDIIRSFNDDEIGWTTRLVSLALIHGAKIDSLVTSLQKDGNLHSFNKVLARVLKKYIPDGQKVEASVQCGECGSSQLVWQEGCVMCASCGHSKCM